MRWSRAVHHVETLAEACAETMGTASSIFEVRVTGLWAVGDLLEAPRDLEAVTVAVSVDRPEVAWWTEPRGARHWANAVRLPKNPILAWWRSAHAPVWNHRIVRPVLVWDAACGVRADALAALREGRAEPHRLPAPSSPEYRARLADDLATSLRALREATDIYDRQRWSPGKLDTVADAQHRAALGYLDLLDSIDGTEGA